MRPTRSLRRTDPDYIEITERRRARCRFTNPAKRPEPSARGNTLRSEADWQGAKRTATPRSRFPSELRGARTAGDCKLERPTNRRILEAISPQHALGPKASHSYRSLGCVWLTRPAQEHVADVLLPPPSLEALPASRRPACRADEARARTFRREGTKSGVSKLGLRASSALEASLGPSAESSANGCWMHKSADVRMGFHMGRGQHPDSRHRSLYHQLLWTRGP